MALQSPQPVLQLPPWMWPFGVACPTEPRGKPHMAGLRLRGRAHGHPLPWLAMWEWLWAWAPGGVSTAYPGANSSSRLLCLAVGQLDRPPDLTDDGYDSQVTGMSSSASMWVGTSPWIDLSTVPVSRRPGPCPCLSSGSGPPQQTSAPSGHPRRGHGWFQWLCCGHEWLLGGLDDLTRAAAPSPCRPTRRVIFVSLC